MKKKIKYFLYGIVYIVIIILMATYFYKNGLSLV